MSKGKIPMWIPVVVILGVIGIGGMIIGFNVIGVKNQDVELTNQFDAQIEVNKVIYDEVTKVIFGKAQVASKYAKDFANTYTELMSARYAGKNPMMNWIKEQNPTLDASIYKEISKAIEMQRGKFTRAQTRMIDIKREHDNLRERFPSSIMMSWIGSKELELKLVTSTRVEKAFDAGVDDNADPFAN